MSKFFNTSRLCKPGKHYMVNPLKRLLKVEQLIRNELYFTIHAPRQASAFEESLPMEIETSFFVDKNNDLNMKKIMLAFQEFYRENAESWLDRLGLA